MLILPRVASALDQIEMTSSRNSKTQLLVGLLEDKDLYPLVSRLYRVGLDPQISTFLTRLPDHTTGATKLSDEETYNLVINLLDSLINGRRLNKAEWQEVTGALLYNLTPPEFKWVSKCLTKDWTLGTSISTYNKAAQALLLPTIEEFDTVRVSNIQDARLDYSSGVYVSVKKDGVNATYDPLGVLRSRNGNLIPLSHLEAQLRPLQGAYVIFGELVSTNRQSSSGLCNSAIKLGYESKLDLTPLQLYVFDAMEIGEYTSKNFTTPFRERQALAQSLITNLNQPDIKLINHQLVYSLEDVYRINDQFVQQGEEGIVINSQDMLFEFGRSKQRARIKEVLDGDFEIIDVLPHSRHPDWAGSLTVRSSDGLVITNTGSGLNEIAGDNKNRIEIWQNRDNIIGKIARVKYNKVILSPDSSGFSLFIPVLDEIRDRSDKSRADSFYELALGSNQKHEDLLKTLNRGE